MSSIRRVLLLLIFVDSGLHAQEIRYIDFPFAEQRTELRHPRGDCKEGMLCGGFGGGGVFFVGPRPAPPPSLRGLLFVFSPTPIKPLPTLPPPFTRFYSLSRF